MNTLRRLFVQAGLVAAITLFFLFSAADVFAQENVMRRYALYIGSNYGGSERATLSYAVTDARAVSEVMQQLGGVLPRDGVVLTDPSPALVDDTVNEIRRQIASGEGAKRSEFFFYYSGHSDDRGLLLGDRVYKYEDLKDTLDSVGADVNIAVLDSCSSGSFTRMKGGVRRTPFLADTSVDASGHAFLTSSSEDEAAQESDDLGASFFTHYFVTALRGAADSALDGTVSLNEAYSYASSETLARTEDTMAGPQHPSYDIQLAGTGDLILTDLRAVSEQIRFEENLRGRIFVRDSAGRLVVELKKIQGTPLAVSIGPGRYSMILDDGEQLLSAELMLAGGSKVLVVRDEFYPVPRASTRSRGGSLVELPEQDGQAEENALPQRDTVAELDEIARRAEKRALAAAGRSEAGGEEPSWSSEEPKALPAAEDTDEGFSFGIVADAGNFEGFQVGLIGAAASGSLEGFQVGSIFTDTAGTVDGFQAAGVWNSTGLDLDGVQAAGVWNSAGNVSVLQAAGVFNTADGYVNGVQLAGIFNESAGDVSGVQAAGIWNSAGLDLNGVQAAGVWNSAGNVSILQAAGVFNTADNVVGAQLAGLFNTAADVTGVQLAGIFNTAADVNGVQFGLFNFGGKVSGVQVGLVNISDELYGVPIGLINISGNGLHDASVWYDDRGFVNLGYQLGTPSFYTFASIGVSSDDFARAAEAGLGMGLELAIETVHIDIDIYSKSYKAGTGSLPGNIQGLFTGTADYFPAARLSGGIELFGFLTLFGGVNLDCRVAANYPGFSFDIGGTAASSYTVEPARFTFDNNAVLLEMYPSWFLGIRI